TRSGIGGGGTSIGGSIAGPGAVAVRRYQKTWNAHQSSHTIHATISAVEKCPTTVRVGIVSLFRPGERRAVAQRVFLEQRIEDRRAGALALHGRAQGLIEIDPLVAVQHEDDHNAPLIGGVAGAARGRRITG